MARRKHHSAEEIVNKLRRADVELCQRATIAQACKQIGVTEQTYYRRHREFGGLKADQARRLKRLVADLSQDKLILQGIAPENL